VRDKALMVIAEAVLQRSKADLLSAAQDQSLDADMRRKAQALLKGYGVKVHRLGLVELAGARPYRVMQGGGTDPSATAILL